jgi:hypothetical protein
MDPFIICPACDKLLSFSTYFGGYFCNCGWKDNKYKKERIKFMKNLSFSESSIEILTI